MVADGAAGAFWAEQGRAVARLRASDAFDVEAAAAAAAAQFDRRLAREPGTEAVSSQQVRRLVFRSDSKGAKEILRSFYSQCQSRAIEQRAMCTVFVSSF